MQRKALKQLGKVTQWTNEKVFSGEKTQLSSDFTEFEKDVDVRRIGIERLHATSLPFFHQITKVKPTADPLPPSGSGKEKILHTEALGLVMIDYGGDVGGTYGEGLAKYGRARCKLAVVQEEFGSRLRDGYIGGMEQALEAVNEYKTFRKKLDSRRLALDSAISRLQSSKKDSRSLETEVDIAKQRFEETEEETQARMMVIQEQEEGQWAELSDLLEAELEYFTRCKDILEELRDTWPTGTVTNSTANRPRAKSNASARSLNRAATTRSLRQNNQTSDGDDEETPSANRSRSQSNASSTGRGKERRSIIPSFPSFGKKSAPQPKRTKNRYDDESRVALHSEEEEDDIPPLSPTASFATNGRTRSQSTLSASRVSLAENDRYAAPPPMRRTHTTPSKSDARYVKALYDFAGGAADELRFTAGEVIEVKKEVSGDWWIGEIDGRAGMFPSTYVEEYVPTPTTAVPLPARRTLPPSATSTGAGRGRTLPLPAPATIPVPALSRPPAPISIARSPSFDHYATSESELDSHGFSDAEHNATAALASSAQPPSSFPISFTQPITQPSKPSIKKPAPPPPPPSRRSASSNNILASTSAYLSPPKPSYARRGTGLESSPEGSPFAGSEEEDGGVGEADEIYSNSNSTSGGSSQAGSSHGRVLGGGPGGGGGLSTGLGGMHLGKGRGDAGGVGECGVCGCGDFTQNVFKAKGTCSTCFHQH